MWLWVVPSLAVYLLALNLWRDQVPSGLNNDAAEEALRGVELVVSGRLEPINFFGITPEGTTFGNSMETLFLYLLGLAARVLGTTTMAIHATTWVFALATIALTCLMVRRIAPAIPVWIPLTLGISSIWLFHYARSGLRANTAPFFLLVCALLAIRLEGPTRRPVEALACGAAMGLSLYAYTSCRVLPVAFALHALVRLVRAGEARGVMLRRYATVLLGALLACVPLLLSLLHSPREVLLRGSYVLRGGLPDWVLNVVLTFLLPIYYPTIENAAGPAYYFDGVGVSLTAAGIKPLHPLLGVAFLIGLAVAWSRRREAAISYLLITWLVGSLILGIAGPSLTRLLVLLPVYLVFAALGLGRLARSRLSKILLGAALAILIALQGRSYFVTYAHNPAARRAFSSVAATPMGQRARALAAAGARVICVESSDGNVIRYLTYDVHHNVRVVEFLNRVLDPGEIPLHAFRPHVVLVEGHPGFEPLRAVYRRIGAWTPGADFDEFDLDPAWQRRSSGASGDDAAPAR